MPILGGTDTARVERLREIMAAYHAEWARIPEPLGPMEADLADPEGFRLDLVRILRARTLSQIEEVLAEDWEP